MQDSVTNVKRSWNGDDMQQARSRDKVPSCSHFYLFFLLIAVTMLLLTDLTNSATEVTAVHLTRDPIDERSRTLEEDGTFEGNLVRVGYVSNNVVFSCENETIQLNNCGVVIDLECPHKYRTAFYHRIMDCLAYEYGGIKQAATSYRNPCFIGYVNRAEFYSALIEQDMRMLCRDENVLKDATTDKNWTSLLVQPKETKRLPIFKPNRANVSASLTLLIDDLQSSINTQNQTNRTVLLVQRKLSRGFSEDSFRMLCRVFDEFALKHGRSLDVYNGTETVEDTIRKFHMADIVLHFHGAAFANLLFASRGARVIEITTFSRSDDSVEWRSNVAYLGEHRPDIDALIFRIPLAHLWPNVNLSMVDELEGADQYIKHLSDISLRRSDVDNLAEIVKTMLRSNPRIRM